jgi:uncharacterized protein (TIGR02246 family)
MSEDGPVGTIHAWGDAFHAKDLDAMMDLFEPDAIWVSDKGDVITGADGIRGVFRDFLALDASFDADEPQVLQTGDIALLHFGWTVEGSSADGEPLKIAGRTADVLRRQPDGRWLYIIDDPFGGG